MQYELLFQFSPNFLAGDDAIVRLSETLRSILEDSADLVDHDETSRGVNFVIRTSNPKETFARCKYVLAADGLLESVTVAFRRPNEQTYTVIWPIGTTRAFTA